MLLTEREKNIYNTFLIVSRSIKNKPFSIRKDFANIDDKTFLLLKKLNLFFDKNNLNVSDFFAAPYHYYGKDNYFDLSFFVTPKAIKCYSLYLKKKETNDPDSEDTIQFTKQCLSFLFKFCDENKISLHEYKNAINGTTPLVLQHLKDHKINFYTVHGLECDKIINQTEPDLLDFFISSFYNTLNETRINFHRSVKLKTIVREGLSIIENKLLKNKINNIN